MFLWYTKFASAFRVPARKERRKKQRIENKREGREKRDIWGAAKIRRAGPHIKCLNGPA
jgi:hypothetical protein